MSVQWGVRTALGGALVLLMAACGEANLAQDTVEPDAAESSTTTPPLVIEPDDPQARDLCNQWLKSRIDDTVAANLADTTEGQAPREGRPDWVVVAGYDSTLDEAIAWSEGYLHEISGFRELPEQMTRPGRELAARSEYLTDPSVAVCWIRGTFSMSGYAETVTIVSADGDAADVVIDTKLRNPVRPTAK